MGSVVRFMDNLKQIEGYVKYVKMNQNVNMLMIIFFTLAVKVSGLLTIFVPSNITTRMAVIVSSTLITMFLLGSLLLYEYWIGGRHNRKSRYVVVLICNIIALWIFRFVTNGMPPNLSTMIALSAPSMVVFYYFSWNLIEWSVYINEIAMILPRPLMPSRTPLAKIEWQSLLPLPPEKCAKPSEENNEEIEIVRLAAGKEYDLQPGSHLGVYKTVRGVPIDEDCKSMGIGTNILSKIEKNKTSDGLTIPLTHNDQTKSSRWCSSESFKTFFRTVIRDWIFLALLGFIMAALSFGMDYAILNLQNGQMRLYDIVKLFHWSLGYLVWVGYVVGLILLSAVCAHYIAPQAIGSGIPEMKTILRGVILKEYLSIRTLVSKMIGLTLSLGSGLPMGKEGPFVHVASVVASQLTRLVHGSNVGIYENESRSGEMLAAGCAVGVACTFSAPIGGVLFSIEVTSVYFAVRNYWRGFFAATCSATIFRILRMFSASAAVTVEAHYQTNFPPQNVFLPQELPVFALVGLICGLAGSLFVYLHRRTVLFLRRNSLAKMIFQKYWLLYPIFIAFFISSLSWPSGLGKLMGGQERFSHTMKEFFVNCAWTASPNNSYACAPPVNMTPVSGDNFDIRHWTGQGEDTTIPAPYSPFVTLSIFQFVYFFLAILASTLPVPSGIFMPVFVLGAAFGRLVGEGVFTLYPDGYESGDVMFFIRPGVYAVVGAAAFCGAVTHTVSVAVIVFEITGQLCHLLPVMIAVLIANAVASWLQPSIYDSIIRIKNLPYLPDIPHTTSLYHQMLIEQFMISPVVFIAKDSTVGDVRRALQTKTRIRAFPLVENLDSLALVGSISRGQLQRYVDSHIGTKARFAEATRRVKQRLEDEESERRRKEESKSDETADSLASKGAGERRASRFLVVPVAKNGSQVTKNENLSGLSDENARKILTVEEKKALFDAVSLKVPKGEMNGRTVTTGHIESHHTIGGEKKMNSKYAFHFSDIFRSITHLSFGRQNIPKKNNQNEFDLYGGERAEWEESVLETKLDLSQLDIDSTPFQLSEYTSLFKAHSLFSLLGLNRAYVTKKGQLIGVVALKELRFAMEYLQAGKEPTPGISIFTDASADQTTFEKSGRIESGMDSQNPTFLTDNGEEDASDDYIQVIQLVDLKKTFNFQPPLEVVRRGALTPNQLSELNRVENVRLVPDSPNFEVSSPSTSSSCVSIDLSPLDTTYSDNGSVGGLVLNVPSLPSRARSAAELNGQNSHVQINLPDNAVHDEKF
ncbi:CRE-CLH-3 protein [Caenorhabditis remanei]|uniref:Chloride channel protein n=1 Tax=Caenorhabditis remanei TaxID=31234 RepID=E3LQH7_CAERE|nr:CRE-CLH-3 protein [Caenorhabditis remanei]